MNNKNNFPSPLSKKNPKNFQIITKPGVLLTNSAQKKSAADLVTKLIFFFLIRVLIFLLDLKKFLRKKQIVR